MTTPLVIPSLSTRNVGRLDQEDDQGRQRPPVSYASMALEFFGNHIDEALLVSAYDLHYRALHESEHLLSGGSPTPFHHPNLLMLDSGLYETRERVGYDDGYEKPKDWTPEMYDELLAALPEDLSLAIVNYDLNADQLTESEQMSYSAQLDRARRFFSAHTAFASVCLLKPERPRGFIEPLNLTSSVAELKEFDIVAVTEKELGNTLFDRFAGLIALRRLLRENRVEAPIHVFGGLDPLLTPLYIACGAEIVDGVGWLRYAYSERNDTATYIESRPVLDLDLESRVPTRLFYTLSDNLTYLRSLKSRLQLLIDSRDWRTFSPAQGEVLDEFLARVFSKMEVT
jgi:hypothetical protein